MSDAAKINDPPPRHSFGVVVCGSASAPEAFIHRKLTGLTAAKRMTHNVYLIVAAGEEAATSWASHSEQRLPTYFEPVLVEVYGRRNAPVRWAMKVVADVGAVVIFGDPAPWWRVIRYAEQAGVPVRRVAVPMLASREFLAPTPPLKTQAIRTETVVERPGILAQRWFGGDGPLGLPH